MEKYKTLLVEKKDSICILTLNRPDKMNALSMQMIDDLFHFFASMADDHESRIIIFRGAGRAFCSGADLDEVKASAFHGHADKTNKLGPVQFHYEKVMKMLGGIILNMRRCPQPIIGAIHGPAVGGGFNFALACDVRIAAQSLRMSAGYILIGLTGCEMGSSYFLSRIIGFSRAAEYLYTGRMINAAEADRIGLVSRVVPDDELENAALNLAKEMLRSAPFALRITKEAYNLNVDAPSLESAINLESRQQSLMTHTKDHMEGSLAMLEKRKPVFKDQ